jgi:hypothetical protein
MNSQITGFALKPTERAKLEETAKNQGASISDVVRKHLDPLFSDPISRGDLEKLNFSSEFYMDKEEGVAYETFKKGSSPRVEITFSRAAGEATEQVMYDLVISTSMGNFTHEITINNLFDLKHLLRCLRIQ